MPIITKMTPCKHQVAKVIFDLVFNNCQLICNIVHVSKVYYMYYIIVICIYIFSISYHTRVSVVFFV